MGKRQDAAAAAQALATAVDLRVLVGKLKRKLREGGHFGDFTLSQIAVLSHLEREGPATVTALAHAEGVRSQSMGATVAVLEAAGMISGAPDPTDGRRTIMSLTDACRERIHASRAAREDWLFNLIRSKLSVDEQTQLANGVALLKRLVDT